jgi:hypothetical protein
MYDTVWFDRKMPPKKKEVTTRRDMKNIGHGARQKLMG